MFDVFIILPAMAAGWFAKSLRSLAIGLGAWVVVENGLSFLIAGEFWSGLLLRALSAAIVSGVFYLAAGPQRRWERP